MTTKIPPHPGQNHSLGRFAGNTHKPLMAMIEITNRCNMHCPVCFTTASKHAEDVTIDEIKQRLVILLHTAGPIPLQISGGEPTLHPQLAEVIGYARTLGFANIELVTNGIRISRDYPYLAMLVDKGLTAVYLQFDGLERQTYEYIRGQDMSSVRQQSIETIRKAGVCCTLAVAVLRGVNDHEIGAVINFAIDNIETVRAINFQAATQFTGRFAVGKPRKQYSLSELTALIEKQVNLPPGGFISDVIGHESCNAMSLVYLVEGCLEPLFAHVSKNTRDRFLEGDDYPASLISWKAAVAFCQKLTDEDPEWTYRLPTPEERERFLS